MTIDRRYSVAEGQAIKSPCRVATTANIALTGLQTIDGVVLADGDRVLVKDQTTASENGIYSASTGDWERTKDFDGAYDVVTGTLVLITSGTVAARYVYTVSTTGEIVVGTTSIAFQQDQSSSAIAAAAAAAGYAVATAADRVQTGLDRTAAEDAAADAQAAAASLVNQAGFHNRIVNPNGQIAQQGVASTSDGNYSGIDQWYILTQSNAVTPSQLTSVENGTPHMMRVTQANATPQRFGLAQPIESANVIDLRGQTLALSARVRMSASTTLRFAIVEWTGTADSLTKDIVNDWTSTTFTPNNFFINTTTTVVATGSQALTANTLATISLIGTVSGSMNNLIVLFWTDSTQAQNVTFDLAKVQLEIGSTSTGFAPRSYGEELRLCKRYYMQFSSADDSSTPFSGGYSNSSTAAVHYLTFPVELFRVPTLSINAASSFAIVFSGTAVAATAIGLAAASKFSALIQITVAAGLSANDATILRANSTTGARMNFDARL